MTFKKEKEIKVVNGVKLSKATTQFRGRDFVVWYDANSKIKAGPWKFENIDGLIYEVEDSRGNFKWTLEKINNVKENIVKPFDEKTVDLLAYTEYPKLKYAISPQLQEDLRRQGRMMKEQVRDGLELKFEWEE